VNGYCIGIDFGGTFLKFGVLDGRLAAGPVVQLPTPDPPAGEALIEQMARGCRQALEAAGVRRSDVRAAGIGSPGPIDISAGRIVSLPNLPGLRDFPIRDRLAEALELPAFLENDANAAAYGEYIAGSGREARDMVFLTLGTGVGGGVVIDGRILHGAHDMAAELGHIIVEPDGESCGCGQRGCWSRAAKAALPRAARPADG
jgi:glucokinase